MNSNCANCFKPNELCVCASIDPVENKVEVVILQHPQEKEEPLSTARIASASLKRSKLLVGLSWPSLNAILGRKVDPKRWLVLYLGSQKTKQSLPPNEPLVLVDKKGKPLQDYHRLLSEIEGIIALDGSWSEVKSMWWRNAWLLKLRRGVLNPAHGSLYGRLRRAARKEGISTLESLALTLSILEKREYQAILEPFVKLLALYQQHKLT